MCYPCTRCNSCGKFNEGNLFYQKPGKIPCFKCGGEVNPETGRCETCGDQALMPAGGGSKFPGLTNR